MYHISDIYYMHINHLGLFFLYFLKLFLSMFKTLLTLVSSGFGDGIFGTDFI